MRAKKTTTDQETSIRAKRFGELLRQELSTLVAFELKDPKAEGAVITRVEVSPDLRIATVHVRLLEATPDRAESTDEAARRRAVIAALRRGSGMMRREVTTRLQLRYAPELRFVYDEGVDHTSRIEELLEEIAAERRSR